MRTLFRASGGVLAAVLGLIAAQIASAQTYPDRPITVVVPFTPGASTDAVARLTQDILARELGQPIVIENRPGAGGTLGSAVVANAQPDGYTLLVTVNSPLTTNMFVQKTYPFDARRAFAPISLAAESVLVLAVNAKLPVTTVRELVDYVKRNPGKVSYGSAGVGSAHQIAGEMINQRAGIDMAHVPYRGSAPAIQDLVAGSIQVSFGTTPAVLPLAQEGTIRILALAEARRHPDLPGIPTIDETYPGIITNTWVGFLAPARTPRAIISRLNAAMNLALRQPDVIEKFKVQGLTAVGSSPEDLQRLITEEYARWEKALPALGIQPK
jgi:tripartite-type tricarboxylate transporter receptor subunit TctC